MADIFARFFILVIAAATIATFIQLPGLFLVLVVLFGFLYLMNPKV